MKRNPPDRRDLIETLTAPGNPTLDQLFEMRDSLRNAPLAEQTQDTRDYETSCPYPAYEPINCANVSAS